MKTNILLFLSGFFAFVLSASKAFGQDSISYADFAPVVGYWEGDLTYLDYSTNKTTTIPASIAIQRVGWECILTMKHQFKEEPNVVWTDTLIISKDGRMIHDEKVESRSLNESGVLAIVTTSSGVDGNDDREALFRHTYEISPDRLKLQKEVQFKGESTWFVRNTYSFQKRAKHLSPAEMKEDLAIMKAVWENIHPGIYRYNTPQEIDKYFAELDSKTNSALELKDFYLLIAELNIKLNCGHSFVSYYNTKRITKANLYSRSFFPFLFRVIDNKFIITHNLSDNPEIKAGDEIVSIDGIPVKRIIDSLLPYSKADGENGMNKKLDNISIHPHNIDPKHYCLFDIFFPLLHKKELHDSIYNIEIESYEKGLLRREYKALSKEMRSKTFNDRYGVLPKNEETWYVKPIDNQTVLFRLGDFATYNWKFDFNHYLDSVFTDINQKGYQYLIVDIRQNEGGADEARDAVLSYLTPKKIPCSNDVRNLYRYISIPDSLHGYLDTWDESFKQPKVGYVKTADGFYESSAPQGECSEIIPKENRFKGRIILLTDVTNSSATFIMAECFRKNNLGLIIGEKTGGTQQGINGGELFFFYLPNSEVEMDLPLIYQCPVEPKPDEGVVPDISVITNAEHIRKNVDPQLEFALMKIRGMRGK